MNPIVIVTGYQSLELEHHLSDYGVIFIHNERYDQMDKFESVKLGLSFLKDKCDQLFFTSVKNPMFMPSTLIKMTQLNKKVIVPLFDERAILLLCLIRDAGSIQGACRQMALSRAKAWEMITVMEEEFARRMSNVF